MTTVAKWWDEARRVGRRITYGHLLPLCALFTITVVGMGLPAAINAAQGEGQAGTFIAEHRSCAPMRFGGESCSWYGTFESADDSVRVADVLLNTDSPQSVGDRVAVLYEGESDPPKVYLADGSTDWLWGLVLLLGGIGYLAWGGWRLLRSRTRGAAG
jgi:hypothetical protein